MDNLLEFKLIDKLSQRYNIHETHSNVYVGYLTKYHNQFVYYPSHTSLTARMLEEIAEKIKELDYSESN